MAYDIKDIDTYTKELKHAVRFLNELMGSLDYTYNISYELMSLYVYVNKVIITAIFKKNPELLDSAESVMKLLVGFEGVGMEDTSGPVMQNTQQLYAGLTYGRGVLNEVTVDPYAAK